MDIITLIIYGLIIFLIFNLFITLAPVLIPLVVVTMVINYFVRRKRLRDYEKAYRSQSGYADSSDSYQNTTMYETRGNIKHDVIDVEYTETEAKE